MPTAETGGSFLERCNVRKQWRLAGLATAAIAALPGYAVASGKVLLPQGALAEKTAAPADAPSSDAEPGSPRATTTIDGRYLPPPPPKFGGEINLGTRDSRPWWPPLPFRFNGKLAKMTIMLVPEQLTAEDRRVIGERLANARD